MRNNFLICTLLAGLTESLTLQANMQMYNNDEQPTDLGFSEVEIESVTNPHCGAAHDRIKNAQNIFYGVQAGSSEYVDTTFPRDTMIRDNTNPSFVSGGSTLTTKASEATWVDSIDTRYSDADHSLFGTNGISPQDIF